MVVEGEGTGMKVSILSQQGLEVSIKLAWGMGSCKHANQNV